MATIDPDELVFGNAAQLRAMAATLDSSDDKARGRAAAASATRVAAFAESHPGVKLSSLVGRPVAAVEAPVAQRTGRVWSQADGDQVDIYVDGYITSFVMFDDEVSASIVRQHLADAGGKPVRVHINSGGGDYFEGLAMASAIRDYSGPTYAAVDSLAASAASVVAIAADTVGIGAGAFIMIHEASTFAYGNAADMLSAADMLDAVSAEIAEVYSAKTGQSAEAMRELMLAETWMGPARAVKEGLADERMDGKPAAAPEPDPDEDPDEDEEPDPDDPGEDDEDEEEEDEPMPMPPENRRRTTPRRAAATTDPVTAFKAAIAKAGIR